jgi:hypothetical protein
VTAHSHSLGTRRVSAYRDVTTPRPGMWRDACQCDTSVI